jgi:hypothetical protein
MLLKVFEVRKAHLEEKKDRIRKRTIWDEGTKMKRER